jgi:hypothetical protein
MKTFEINCYTNENYDKEYELIFSSVNSNGRNYYILSMIRNMTREDLDRFSSFLKDYLENN